MTQHSTFKASLLLTALLSLSAVAQAQTTMSREEHNAAKTRIGETLKADRKACDSLSGNGKDICMEEAKGKEKISLAEIDHARSGKPADMRKLAEVKADAAYAVAKEKCDDLAGNPKSVCVTEAKANHEKSLADAKVTSQVSEARADGAQAKRDADYRVAIEKCDALAGNAKASCVASAKAQFNKS